MSDDIKENGFGESVTQKSNKKYQPENLPFSRNHIPSSTVSRPGMCTIDSKFLNCYFQGLRT